MPTDVAEGQPDRGEAVKVGGVASAAAPVKVEGGRTSLSFDLAGGLRVSGAAGGSVGVPFSALTTGRVATAVAETLLLADNPARKAVYVQNVGVAAFALRFATGGVNLVEIPIGGAWETPAGVVYTGPIYTAGAISTAAFVGY